MGNRLLLLLILSGLIKTSELSGQVYTYDGPAIDYNFIMKPPSDYDACDDMTGDPEAIKACFKGIQAAREMAERFGQGHGKLQGFITGFSYGLRTGVETTIGDPSAMEDGRELGRGMMSSNGVGEAISKGEADGYAEGNEQGTDLAHWQFAQVSGSGQPPKKDLGAIPDVSVPYIQDAFGKYVRRPKNLDQMVESAGTLEGLPVYHSFDATVLAEYRPPTIFDLFQVNGVYSFEKLYWNDKNAAFKTYIQTARNSNYWESLKDKSPKDPDTDEIIYEDGLPLLQSVFKKSFMGDLNPKPEERIQGAYKYYVNHYFSLGFHQELGSGQFSGVKVGREIGLRYAEERGAIEAFENQFNQDYQYQYQAAFDQGYNVGYEQLFQTYLEEAMINIVDFSIVGDWDREDGGIHQPGEPFRIKFELENRGFNNGNIFPVEAYLTGNITNWESFNSTIAPLSFKDFQSTNIMGNIDKKMGPRESGKVQLHIKVPGRQDVVRTLDLTVNNAVEVTGVYNNTTVLQGVSTVNVDIKNLTQSTIDGTIIAQVVFDEGGFTGQQTTSGIGGGESRTLSVSFEGLDPLVLIRDQYSAQVNLKFESQNLESWQIDFLSDTRNNHLVSYFDKLANNSREVFVPSQIQMGERLKEVMRLIVQTNELETRKYGRGYRMYKRTPHKMILGMLSNEQVRPLSDKAASIYDDLARELWPYYRNLRLLEKKHYKRLVKSITSHGKSPLKY